MRDVVIGVVKFTRGSTEQTFASKCAAAASGKSEVDSAGYMLLEPGGDPDAEIHDPVAAERDWRRINAVS